MATQLEEAARVDAEEGSPSPEVKVYQMAIKQKEPKIYYRKR